MSASGLKRYREPMKISLPATLLALATMVSTVPMVSTVHGYPVQDAKTVDEAVEAKAQAEGEQEIGKKDIEAAVTEALGILLDQDLQISHGEGVVLPLLGRYN